MLNKMNKTSPTEFGKKGKARKTMKQGSESLTVSWEKNPKTNQGKVFKKKKDTTGECATEKNNNFVFNKDFKNNMSASGQSPKQNFAKASMESKHIKRKQRKDKLLAKKSREDAGNTEVIQGRTNDNQKKGFSLFSEREKDVYVNVPTGKSVSEVVFVKETKFSDLDIHRHVVSNVEKLGFTVLTNVQEKAIPLVLKGRNALIRSQTGSGKTLAYAVPIIDALQGITPRIKRADGVQALVVVPTRELALQAHDQFSQINTFQWIVVGHLCGGESRKTEKERIRKGLSVLIGTPGRLLDHALHTSAFSLSNVRCLVLDEADRLLDMGFRRDITTLISEIDKAKANSEYNPLEMFKQNKKDPVDDESNHEVPVLRDVNSKERQTILLSATLTKDVNELANLTMKDHVYIDALEEGASTKNEDDYVIPSTVHQEFIVTFVKHRLFTLSSIIVARSKLNSKLFVFMASTHMVEFHYDLFAKYLVTMPKNRGKPKTNTFKGEKVVVFDDDEDEDNDDEVVLDVEFFKLHGNMDQKERKRVFTDFRKAKKGVLLCTDVAARGLDVPEADCIIQYTPPQSDKDYLHRVGRTGRAGKSGSAVIFLTHEEQDYVSHLKDHKVFLKNKDPKEFLFHLCDLMDEPNFEEAATALQRHFEAKVVRDKALNKSACFAFSTWSRFYNSYSARLRHIFDFKKINLGHYVTSFALTVTPTDVSRVVRGQVVDIEKTRLNKKLANHEEDIDVHQQRIVQKKRKNINSSTSEYASGLEPMKKKKRKQE